MAVGERRTLIGGHGLPLGYAEYGRADGPPVLLQHGLFGSAELGEVWAARADRAGIRLVAVERPGYGGSAPAQMRSVADWAGIVDPLLELLGAPADVVGISAGAPYTYALAALRPERVRAGWLLSGLPYVYDDAVRGHYPDASLRAWEFFGTGDPEQVGSYFAGEHDRFVAAFAGHLPMQRALAANLATGYAGPAREARLQVRRWGFTPADVLRPITAWHSRGDDQVPFDAVEDTIALVPGGRLLEQVEPGHLPSAGTLDALFDALADPDRDPVATP